MAGNLPGADKMLMAAALGGYVYAGGGDGRPCYRYDPMTDTWTFIASLPVIRSLAASDAYNGRWVLAGGDVGFAISNSVIAYDPATNTWTSLPDMLQANDQLVGATVGQAFHVLGGSTDNEQFIQSPCATPSVTPTPTATPTCTPSRAWVERAPYPIAVSGNAVVSVGGAVYSFGGIANNTAIANAYKYTPATNSWIPIASLPAPRGWFSAASDGTYIYLLGGVDQNFTTTATLWRYDPVSNTYNTSLPSYTIPTYFHASVYLNGKIYRVGGRDAGAADYHVEVYNIGTNTWSMAANYPFANYSLMAAALDGYIYAGGGSNFPDKTYRYDPNTNTWDDSAIADLPAYRSAAASGVYNGRWILAGGDVNFGISSSVMAWDPASNTWSNLPNMVQARDNLGGATVGQSFYAVAGNSGPGPPTNDNQQYTETPCGTPTPTPTSTVTPTATPTPTATARPVPAPRSRPTPAPRP